MFELLKLGLPRSKTFSLGLLVSLLQGISAVALLATSAWLISRATEQPPVMYLMIAVVGVRGFALGRSTFRYAERILLHDAAFRMLTAVRPKIFEKLIPLAPAGLGFNSRGDTLTRVGSDTDELQNLPLRVLSPMVQSITVALLTVIGMSILLPSAAISLVIALVVAFFIAIPISAKISAVADRDRAKTSAKLSSQSIELLEHLDLLTAYGWLAGAMQDFKKTDDYLLSQIKQKSLSAGVGQAIFSLVATGATLATSFLGVQAVTQEQKPGVLLALFVLIPMALFDVVLVAQPAINSWRTYKASAKRILEIQEKPVPNDLSPEFGEIQLDNFVELEFTNACLGYPEGGEVIENLNLKLQAGDTLALTGKSGSGKSTIAFALIRFLNLRSGRYTINQKPVGQFTEESVRSIIGLVEQNPTIFRGSVRANLMIANSQATDEKLWQILEQVGLKKTFDLREGLETQLGDRGVLISGGEAQRLALARALLAEFSVIILDEPTANVDQQAGFALVQDLLAAAKNNSKRTVILITHDLDLAALANRKMHLSN